MDDKTWIIGKDAALEDTIASLRSLLEAHGFNPVEIASHNPIPHVWSVQLEDTDCPLCRASGMGTSRDAALASAMGQFLERLACNYFFTPFYMGTSNPDFDFYHHPQERWYASDVNWPRGLIDDPVLQAHYNPEGSLTPAHMVDTNSYDQERGVCSLPYTRLSDGQTQWFPINLIGNLYDSNGMAAGNTPEEARVHALSEVLERHVKFRVVAEGISLPELPDEVLARSPRILESLDTLRTRGLSVRVRDASLGGKYPVINISLLNPENGSCAASFGAHPRFEIALSRALTELLQGRDLEQLERFH
ncbi:MAG: YcaO-like family protein, partial [Granulosicoccaceae bacterium]